MHESAEDLAALQRLIDESHSAGNPHLRSIWSDERRLSAQDLSERLTGVVIVDLATVTSDGRPIVGPVDGLFYRGRFYVGSSPESLRARHIAARPHISLAHTVGEELAVVVHGMARTVDLHGDPENAGIKRYYVETYGETWEEWSTGALYWRVDPSKMFTFGGIG